MLTATAASSSNPRQRKTQPLEVLRPGMKREFVVVEDEDEYGEIILSLAAIEVRALTAPTAADCSATDCPLLPCVLAAAAAGCSCYCRRRRCCRPAAACS